MKPYNPSFEDRAARSAEAKMKALERLRSKPPIDEKVVAERQAARAKRDALEAEKRIAKKAAEQRAKEERSARAKAEAKAPPPPPTEAERKRARDARYAARKSRK